KHANPRNKLTNCSVLIQPFDRLDDHSSTNLIAGTVNRNKGKTQLLCGVRDLIVILRMVLDVEDSVLVLHSLLSYFCRDPGRHQLVDIIEEVLVAFKLGLPSRWKLRD